MQAERTLPDHWPQILAARLSLPAGQLDALLRNDENFRETCMDYAECADAVRDASNKSPADLLLIQEYRSLEREIIAELHSLLKKIA